MPSADPTLSLNDLRAGGGARFPAVRPDSASIAFTYNGRGAIYQLARSLPANGRGTVLLPAFHCPTVVDPVLAAGYQVRFYRVDEQLGIDNADLLAKLDADVSAVLAINFLGFPAALESISAACHETGCLIVEDCSHSFLRTNPLRLAGDRGDAATYSFWKLIPSLVGGGLRINARSLAHQPAAGRIPWRDSAVRLKRLLEHLVDSSSNRTIRHAWHRAESLRVRLKGGRPDEPAETERRIEFDYPFSTRLARAPMPWSARWILERVDLAAVADRRKRHYEIYATQLQDHDGVRYLDWKLPDSVCPWAFPVLLDQRSEFDFRLRAAGVPLFTFGETLHPLLRKPGQTDDRTRSAAEYLSRSLLCLAVHQRLKSQDIEQACATIHRLTQGACRRQQRAGR